MKKMIRIASGLAMGVTVGAITAVLTTPRSGRENRDALKEGSVKLRKRLRRGAKDVSDAAA